MTDPIEPSSPAFPDPENRPAPPHFNNLFQLVEIPTQVLYRYRLVPEPGFEYVSTSLEALTGYAPEEIYQDPQLPFRILDPEDLSKARNVFDQNPRLPRSFTIRVRHKNGEWIFLENRFIAVFQEDGSLLAIEGIARNISHRHEIEHALVENRALLSNIIEAAFDAVMVLDDNLNVYLFNSAAEDMFRVTAQEVIGKPMDRFLPRGIGGWHSHQIRDFGKRKLGRHKMGQMRVTTGVRGTGEEFPIEVSLSALESEGSAFYTAIIRDITERKQVEDNLRYLSTHDALTGLYNRLFFEEEIARIERGRISLVSIVIADVDSLKFINDTFGHSTGDELLRIVARAIQAAFRSEDVVARLGGDEFGVLLPGADSQVTAQAVQRIYENLSRVTSEYPQKFFGLSIGAATARDYETLNDTIKRADSNMYIHKNRRTSPPRGYNR